MSRRSECHLTFSPVDGDVGHSVVLTQAHLPPGFKVTNFRVDTVDASLIHWRENSAGSTVDNHTGGS